MAVENYYKPPTSSIFNPIKKNKISPHDIYIVLHFYIGVSIEIKVFATSKLETPNLRMALQYVSFQL